LFYISFYIALASQEFNQSSALTSTYLDMTGDA